MTVEKTELVTREEWVKRNVKKGVLLATGVFLTSMATKVASAKELLYKSSDGVLHTIPLGDLSGLVPYTGATADLDIGLHKYVAANYTTVTFDAVDDLTASMEAGYDYGDEFEDATYYLSVYAYRNVGAVRIYSLVSNEVNIGNNNYGYFSVSFAFTPVPDAIGYKIVLRSSSDVYQYLYGTATSGNLVDLYNYTTSEVTPSAPYDVNEVVADLRGLVPVDAIEFTGKMNIYDTNGALVLGDVSGDARGTDAIDISTARSSTDKVASGTGSVLLGTGKASGYYSVSIGGGQATGSSSISIGNYTASGSNSLGILGTASGDSSLAILGYATGTAAVAIGQQAQASGTGSFALGFYSLSSGYYTITMGRGVQSSGDYSTAIGYNFTDNTANAICFGTGPGTNLASNRTLLKLVDTSAEFTTPIKIVAPAIGANVINDGTFDSGGRWTFSAGWSLNTSQLRASAVSSDANIAKQTNGNLAAPILAGVTYRITYTLSSYTAGGVRAHIGGAYTTVRTGNGTYTEDVTAVTSNLDFWFERQSGVSTSLRIDTLTIKSVVHPYLQLISTPPVFHTKIGYDSSNYFTSLVSSTGAVTFDAVGAGAGFIFSDSITLADAKDIILNTTTGTKIGTATNQKIGFFNATPVVQQTELTDELTSITHTAPGTPDYAIQDLTNSSGYGFVTKDEGNTVLSVIKNLQTRVNELETKLTALGFIADAD